MSKTTDAMIDEMNKSYTGQPANNYEGFEMVDSIDRDCESDYLKLLQKIKLILSSTLYNHDKCAQIEFSLKDIPNEQS